MTFSNFIHKINWPLIAIHLVATFFMIIAARQFAMLNDIGIIKSIDKYGLEGSLKHLYKDGNYSSRIAYFLIWTNLSGLIGLLFGFLISLGLTIKKKMFSLNALIVFIIALLLNRFGLFHIKIINTIFFSLGSLVSHFGLEYEFIINGTILLTLGLFIFFNKWTNNFAFNYQTKKTNVIPEK